MDMTGEKTKGRKRHIVTDTMGNLLCIHVHAANIHDTKGGVYTFEKALYRYPTIQAGCADGGYRGTFRNTFDEFHNIRIYILNTSFAYDVHPPCVSITQITASAIYNMIGISRYALPLPIVFRNT